MKIIGVVWFSGRSTVGIVKVNDEYDGIKYYIGSPPFTGWGSEEEQDKQWIADWGASFPPALGEQLFASYS